jgi:RNA polymerase sigma-70 factor, ECF subfamily
MPAVRERTGAVRIASVVACSTSRETGAMASSTEGALTNGHRRSRAAPATAETFEDVVLPHLDAAYRLARWLLGNEHDAEDVVQESSLRALRYFRTFAGGNGRAWFLRIVRHVCWSWRGRTTAFQPEPFDEERHGADRTTFDPELQLLQVDDAALIERAMRALSVRSRELLVLRELEGLTYQEMAETIDIPIGTVMSGLSRARQAFRDALTSELKHAATANRGRVRELERAGACSSGADETCGRWNIRGGPKIG